MMPAAASLKGARVLIVGGSSGIGLATARQASLLGADVAIAGRDRERLDKAAASLPRKPETMVLDATDCASVKTVFAAAGRIDHLCHMPTAPGKSDRIDRLDDGTARQHFDGRFWGAYHVARSAMAQLAPRGSITFVVGALSRKPLPGRALTTAAQCAVQGLAQGLAVDLAPVRVNTVLAGLTRTALWDFMPGERREAFFAEEAERIPLGLIAEPDHIAAMVMSAVTNPFVTGACLVVDGGTTAV